MADNTKATGDSGPLVALLTDCPRCGASNPPDTRYCGSCGASLLVTQPKAEEQPAEKKRGFLARLRRR